ncbi:MAG TPA: cell wall-binding repeat-containing protein [Nitriliruptorales bacterium]
MATRAPMTRARAPRRAVVASLLTLVASVLVGAPAAGQDGADCLPAGGVTVPFETPEDFDTTGFDLIVHGGGFGHGVGMSQYGAKGAAVAGCGFETILTTYYPGTAVAPRTGPDEVRIGLRQTATLDDHRYVITGASAGGLDVAWHHCDVRDEACDPEPVAVQEAASSADGVWHLRADPDAGQWVLERPVTDGTQEVWRGGDVVYGALQARHEGTVTRYSPADDRNKWGYTQFDYTTVDGGRVFVTEHITAGTDAHTGDEGSAVDRYLWGLAEVPITWPAEALKTQAVAGRSYALAKIELAAAVGGPDGFAACRCDLRPTTVDQHWTGFTHELNDRDAGHPWRAAVQATAELALTYDADPDDETQAGIAQAFYSSSHGGHSDAVQHVWGSPYPYLLAVDTSRWECLGQDPNQRWTRGFTRAELAERFGLDELTDLVVEERGDGGRPVTAYVHQHSSDPADDHDHPRGAVVTGTAGGETVTQRYSGEQLRSKLRKGVVSSALVHLEWLDQEPEPSPSTSSREPAASDTPCAPSDPADPPAPVVPVRVAGKDRVATAAEVARLGWETAEVVVLARSDHPADALAGSALAGKLGAPLLINPSDELEPVVEAVVNELGATSAIMLGGEAALSTDVELQLLDRTTVETVERAAGDDRFATAIDIASRLAPPQDGAAFLVRGWFTGAPEREWPDALAVAGLAAHRAADGDAWPILLTAEELPAATEEALAALAPSTVYVVGGDEVVYPQVEERLVELGYEVVRIAGEDRFGTSREALGHDVVTEQILVLATAHNFPDGLAAGPLAARLGGRLLLVPATYDAARSPWLDGQHPDTVRALGWTDGQVLTVGGSAAVSDEVAQAIRDALNA